MKAVVKTRPAQGLDFIDIPIPEPGSGEVLVKIKAAALCGTDMHIEEWSLWAQKAGIKLPLIVGHECSGEVVELGAGVDGISVGDHIAAETHISCGKCLQCQIGEQHICANLKIFGVHTNGCFAEYAVIPAVCVRRIPDSIPFKTGAVLEPLGTAFRTADEAKVQGKPVVVLGCGPIGLFAVGAARMMGASKVIAVDISEFRLAGARTMGADYVINPGNDNVVDAVLQLTGGYGADAVIEASGSVDAIKHAFKYLRKGGRFGLIGLPTKPIQLEIGSDIVFKEAKVFGVHGRKLFETWRGMEEALASGKIDISPVISHEIPLESYGQGITLARKGQVNKVILVP